MMSLIVHGGAWAIPDDMVDAHREGVSRALAAGWRSLQAGNSAADVVVEVIRILEDDITFDAGTGSHLNASGQVELDASIMNGRTMRCGAVAGLHNVKNPIALARKIMDESEHILLVGSGAERFAIEHGIELCRPDDLLTPRELVKWKEAQQHAPQTSKNAFRKVNEPSDTVGAVAMDKNGEICVGTSTGGTFNKYPGRVGDSPLIGCGSYVDNLVGGVSTTGWGEAIIKVVLAKTVVDFMDQNGGLAPEAAERGIKRLSDRVDGYGGVIAMNAKGEVGVAFNTPRMARAHIREGMGEAFVAV